MVEFLTYAGCAFGLWWSFGAPRFGAGGAF